MPREMVTIVPTATVIELAKKANDIQDACNPYAVTNFLMEVQSHFRSMGHGQNRSGSDMSIQNPISVAVLNKLNHLANMEQSKNDCWSAIAQLALGNPVEWPIDCR